MPQVKVDGKVKKFAYTPEGMDKAKRMALRTGGKLKKRKKTVGARPDTLLYTYRDTKTTAGGFNEAKAKAKPKDNVAKKDPATGLEYMKVPELEYDRQLRMKKEKKEKYKAGARKRAKEIRAKNPNAPWWGKKN
tara:strand:- start:1068 stop:1469 length:402 start_codon:yes stop_codon:yes gene_type:complete